MAVALAPLQYLSQPASYCENRGNVVMVVGLLARPHSLDHFDTTDLDPFLRQVTFNDALLAPALEADPPTVVLHKAETPEAVDRLQVYDSLRHCCRLLGSVDCPTRPLPKRDSLPLHDLSEYLIY